MPAATPAAASRTPCPSTMPTHVARRRAERHADADLVRALRHEVRHHAVDADRRQQQRQSTAKQRQQLHREPALRPAPPRRTSSIVRTPNTGSFGSTARTSRRQRSAEQSTDRAPVRTTSVIQARGSAAPSGRASARRLLEPLAVHVATTPTIVIQRWRRLRGPPPEVRASPARCACRSHPRRQRTAARSSR